MDGHASAARPRGRRLSRAVAILASIVIAVSGAVAGAAPATAITGSDFNPGRIMSDSVFFASGSLDAAGAQAFLQSKVSNCRANYTCLKDYRQNTPTIAADRYCGRLAGASNELASSIITKVAVACGISPKVLIVLLEKEQSLVTDTWPVASQYAKATGYSCPDTAACDPAYSGFVYQVYYAARQYKVYGANASNYRYKAGQTNTIQYHPSSSCGTTQVYIQNQATANLYIYTPYVPNAAALRNLYGTGDVCSAYGNRNFWRIFSDWFGSTVTGIDRGAARSLVTSLYNDILLRSPEAGAVDSWSGNLIGKGWSVNQVADGILYSDEYYLQRIDAAYREVLGRQADAAGKRDWLTWMQRGEVSVDDVRYSFTSSQEFFLRSGGTEESLVRALYTTLLQRTASASDVAGQARIMRERGRQYVIDSIWNSPEAAKIRIDLVYRTFLKRGVDAAGIASWTPLVIANGDQSVRSVVVSSQEYQNRAIARFPQ